METPAAAEGEERVFLGLGSNVGDRDAHLQAALAGLSALPGTAVRRASRFHETAPWGVTEQPAFLNAVVEVRTTLAPEALLEAAQELERQIGRVPTFRWGPRVIDIDLLLYGARQVEMPGMRLPHPGVWEREFVREPLREIAPEVLAALDAARPGADRQEAGGADVPV